MSASKGKHLGVQSQLAVEQGGSITFSEALSTQHRLTKEAYRNCSFKYRPRSLTHCHVVKVISHLKPSGTLNPIEDHKNLTLAHDASNLNDSCILLTGILGNSELHCSPGLIRAPTKTLLLEHSVRPPHLRKQRQV